LQLIGSGGSVGTNEAADGLESLELMIKSWQVEGIKLWTLTEGRIFTVDSQASYSLPGARGCKITELVETTLDADEAAGQTVLSVTSTTGFTNSDVIGIMLDAGTIHWTTISSFVAGDTVTIASALPSAASSGNDVFVYTVAIERPLEILDIRLLEDGREQQINQMSRDDYFRQPDKTTASTPNQWFYDPQLTTGKLYLWPPPSDEATMLNVTYKRMIEDFDSGSNDPDFPAEWIETLGYNLAVRIAPQYGRPVPPEVLAVAGQLKDTLEDWSQETGSIQFSA
jgi:hypothetical protein